MIPQNHGLTLLVFESIDNLYRGVNNDVVSINVLRFRYVFFLIALLALYSFFIEPNLLDVKRVSFLGSISERIQIAHLSDLHFHKFGYLEKKVQKKIFLEKPDLILISGDTLDSDQSSESAALFFKGMSPRYGIWAVPGNWENWKLKNNPELFKPFGVSLLIDRNVEVAKGVRVLGFDDDYTSVSERDVASLGDKNEGFCIALFHSPEYIEKVKDRCPLALAGHTHGGQVNLPFWGPVWLPRGSGRFISGEYQVGKTTMYVSRGVGTSILPMRFLAAPEVTFITVEPK